MVRSPPWLPYLLYGPCIVVVLAGVSPGHSAARCALELSLGALGWTFLEYWMHRLAFHLPPTTPVRRVVSFVLHRHHHVDPEDPERLAATPAQSLGVMALVFGLMRAWLPASDAWMTLAGFAAAYLAYEWSHYVSHFGSRGGGSRQTAFCRRVRAHHLRHHFKDDDANFGISSPLWDRIFGTYRGP